MRYLKKLRVEDLIAILLLSYSANLSAKFYYIIFGHIEISRHILAIILLIIFAIATSIYKIRKTIIVDSIKSEVVLPKIKLKDEVLEIWKNKKDILLIIRDYSPFLIILLSYYTILDNTPSIEGENIFRVPEKITFFAQWIKSLLENNPRINNLAEYSHKSHIFSVPILAIYMYLLKTQRMFRKFMFAISISAIIGVLIAKTNQLGINNLSMPACFTMIVLIYAARVSKPVTHFFIPIAILLLAMDIAINISYVYITIAGILNAITAIFISDTVINTEHRFRRRFFE